MAAVALALLAAFTGAAGAVDSVDVMEYEVEETFTITVNELGDAHCTDILVYDDAFFETTGVDLERYPALLSRRHERQAAVREIQNFSASLDRETATVTLTFDEPGYAYNMGSYWILPFFSAAPTSTSGTTQLFEEDSTVNSEFTLWQDADFKTVTRLELPAGAANIRWDEAEEAMLYELAYVAPAPAGNVLQRNRTASIIVFAVLTAGSLGAAAFLLLRRRSGGNPTPAGAGSDALSGERQATAAPSLSPEAGVETQPAPSTERSAPRFCEACGAALSAGDHFCSGCGRHIE